MTFDRPADIPALMDKIKQYHESLASSVGGPVEFGEWRDLLSTEQYIDVLEMEGATRAYREAVEQDVQNAEGYPGELFLESLKNYHDKWIALPGDDMENEESDDTSET